MPPDIRLTIDGQLWTGWTRARVTRSLDELASSFEIGLVDSPDALARLVARPGSLCKIWDGYHLMVTGFIDAFDIQEEASQYRLTCSGRSLTADIADSGMAETVRFNGQSAAQVAKRIGDLHGIGVQSDTPAALVPLKRQVARAGDAQREVLEKAARLSGVQITDTPSGLIRLCRPDATATDSVGNYLSASISADASQIYARIICRSQVAIPDAEDVDVWSTMAADIVEPLGTRNRTLVITPEQGLDRDGCRRRALVEVARRAGQAVTATVELGDWRRWEPGIVVRFQSAAAGLDAPMVVSDIAWSLDATNGARTTVTLRPPAAFLAEEPRARRRSPGTGSRYWGDLEKYAATVVK